MNTGNLYQNLPAKMPEEIVDTLVRSDRVRIERIVSHAHQSAPGFWYDQEQHEWVVLIQGEAWISFADAAAPVHLTAGDYLQIPAHARHRVDATSSTQATIWLAVFY